MNLKPYTHELLAHIHEVIRWAEAQSIECKRKVVGCSVVTLSHLAPHDEAHNGIVEFVRTTNGPTPGHVCTGEQGNCGCAHAEPRAVLARMNTLNRQVKTILCCNYSPCTRCAQVIIDANTIAGLIDAVVYIHLTEHDVRGRDLLERAGLTVVQLVPPPMVLTQGGWSLEDRFVETRTGRVMTLVEVDTTGRWLIRLVDEKGHMALDRERFEKTFVRSNYTPDSKDGVVAGGW